MLQTAVLVLPVTSGLRGDVHVVLVCCLLAGHSAGGNAGAEGIPKEHSPPWPAAFSDVMRQVRHVFLEALWQHRQDTNQGNWLVPAQPHFQLSPTFSCHMWQTAACRRKKKKKTLLFSHTNIICISDFLSIWAPKDSLWRKVGWPRFNDLSTLSRIAFNLTLMASDKCPEWLQERSALIRRLPVVSHLVCSLFYKCHCHILLNICLSFLGW